MPGVLQLSLANNNISLLGGLPPKDWSGKVESKGSSSSACMLPMQGTESARSHALSQFEETCVCYLKEGKEYSQAADVAAAIWES